MKMTFHSALLAAGMILGGAPAAFAGEDATAYVQAFCSLRTVEGGMGLIHLTSPSLSEAIRGALAENAKLQAATPDEKPPLGDGVPWQSYPDVADSCEPGNVAAEGEAQIAEVKYGFKDNADAGWTDRLVLVAGPGGALVVDDIRYGAEGDDTLRKALAGAFSN